MTIPAWSSLRIAGNSMSGKIATLVPFIGYILVSREVVAHFLTTVGGVELPSLISLRTLYITYYGLCMFGMGSFLYQLLCNSVVKIYESEDVYVASMTNVSSVYDITERLLILRDSLEMIDYKRARAGRMLDNLQAGVGGVSVDTKNFALREYYRLENRKRPIARSIITFLMFGGLAVLSVPTIMTFYKIFFSMIAI